MAIQVVLSQPPTLDEVDSEIIVVAGCALGFVAPRQPPHVLTVEPDKVDKEIAKAGIQGDDLLVAVDGRETRTMVHTEVADALRKAKTLTFERPPKAAGDGEEDDEESDAPAAPKDAPVASGTGEEQPAQQPDTAAASTTEGPRLRSRSRRRRREDGHALAVAAPPAAAHHAPPPPHWGGHYGAPPPMHAAGRPPPPPGWGAPMPMPWGMPPHPAAYGHPPPAPPHYRPPPWGWRPPPHQDYPPHGAGGAPPPPPGAMAPPPGAQGGHGGKEPVKLEANASGGASLVAERVPPMANNMDVLNEYFVHFGPVVAMQINHNRHEAIVTFAKAEHAERALKFPVLHDHSIGLRAWRCKAGQRGPHQVPVAEAPPALKDAVKTQDEGAEAETPVDEAPAGVAQVVGEKDGKVPASEQPGNKSLELGKALEKKRKHSELEDKRKELLQKLTDQLKSVMSKISDPHTNEATREQLQLILSKIKEKITQLTPKEKEQPKLPQRPRYTWHNAEQTTEQEGEAAAGAPKAGGPRPRGPRPPRPPRASWGSWHSRPRMSWVAPWAAGQQQRDAAERSAPAAARAAVEADAETVACESDIEDEAELAAMVEAAEAARLRTEEERRRAAAEVAAAGGGQPEAKELAAGAVAAAGAVVPKVEEPAAGEGDGDGAADAAEVPTEAAAVAEPVAGAAEPVAPETAAAEG